MHERRNGQFVLQVIGHPNYGVPWGQDRLVPIFLATLAMRQQKQTITFRSAAEMLDVFRMQQGGSQYRRLIAAFQRVFGATIFFGTDRVAAKAAVTHQARFNFMREARIWYSRDPDQALLPGGFENMIVFSDEFYREVTTHSIPTDLEAAKALSSVPAALDLICGYPTGASLRKGKTAFQSLVNSGWSHNLAVSSTLGRESFVSGSTVGWI
jgi:Replication initiator protein A